MSYFKESELKSKQVAEGARVKSVYSEKTMITFFEFEPGSSVPMHSHENEQITYVLEGELEFNLNGNIKVLKKGEGVIVPANVEHCARILDKPAKALDSWHPIRDDYKIL